MARRLRLSETELRKIMANKPMKRKSARELSEEFGVDKDDYVERLWNIMNKLSDEAWDEIIRQKKPKNLMQRNVMAKTYGVSESTIYGIWKRMDKHGSDITAFLRDYLTPDAVSELRHEYRYKKSKKKIAKQLGVLQSVVNDEIARYKKETKLAHRRREKK